MVVAHPVRLDLDPAALDVVTPPLGMLGRARAAMMIHARANGNDPWTTTALTGAEVLSMPEIATDIPVAEFYGGTDLAEAVSAEW
jgi:hypothetical protein